MGVLFIWQKNYKLTCLSYRTWKPWITFKYVCKNWYFFPMASKLSAGSFYSVLKDSAQFSATTELFGRWLYPIGLQDSMSSPTRYNSLIYQLFVALILYYKRFKLSLYVVVEKNEFWKIWGDRSMYSILISKFKWSLLIGIKIDRKKVAFCQLMILRVLFSFYLGFRTWLPLTQTEVIVFWVSTESLKHKTLS